MDLDFSGQGNLADTNQQFDLNSQSVNLIPQEIEKRLNAQQRLIELVTSEKNRRRNKVNTELENLLNPNVGKEFVIGAGRGFTDFGENIKQSGLDAATGIEKQVIDLLNPKQAMLEKFLPIKGTPIDDKLQQTQLQQLGNKFTQEAAAERQFFEGTPVGRSLAGKVGRVTGETLPLLALPVPFSAGAKLGENIIKGTQIGATLGATSFIPGENLNERNKQRLSNLIFGGGFGGLGAGAGQGVTQFLNRKAVSDINRLNMDDVNFLQDKAKQTGIDLTPAELTGLPSLAGQQKALVNLPGSSQQMDQFLANRTAQIESSVEGRLKALSVVDDPANIGFVVRKSAKKAISNAEKERAIRAQPEYNKFFEGKSIEIPETHKLISKLKETAKGQTLTKLATIETMLKKEGGRFENRPEALNNAKIEIDNIVRQAKPTKLKQGRESKGLFVTANKIRKQLLNEIDSQTPQYKIARNISEEYLFDVNALENSIVKVIADFPDVNIEKAALKGFQNNSVRSINQIKEQVLKNAGVDAWNTVLRAKLQDSWEKAGRELINTNQNLRGARFRALSFGSAKSKRALKAAMSPKQFKATSDLMDVLEASGSVKVAGSDTVWNTVIMQDIKNTFGGKIATALNPGQYLNKISNFFSEAAIGKNASKLADIVTSPNAINNLEQLRQLKPGTQEWILELGTILGFEIASDAVE